MMVGTVGVVLLEVGGDRRGMLVGDEICFLSGHASGTIFVIDLHMICEMSRRAFFVASPTCRVGKEATGCVKSVIISCAACWRKSSVLTFGIGILCGKKASVSQFISLFVAGM